MQSRHREWENERERGSEPYANSHGYKNNGVLRLYAWLSSVEDAQDITHSHAENTPLTYLMFPLEK